MSEIINVGSDMASEKFYGAKAEQAKERAAERALAKQDPSALTGMQWAAQMPAQQAQAAAAHAKPVADKAQNMAQKNLEIVHPSVEDIAILTTTVAIKEEAIDAPKPGRISRFVADRINLGALEQTFRETYKKSKSHNLLMERFMSNVKFSAIRTLMSLMGVGGDELSKIQSEVREQALSEIDSKIKNDWAYTKAMMEITQG